MGLTYVLITYTSKFLIDILGFVTVLFVLGYVFFKWAYQYWKRKNLPYLEPTIPFGNYQNPSKRVVALCEEFRQLYQRVKANGWRHCGLYALATPTYFVVDLDMVKNVLAKDFQYFVDKGLYTNDKDDPIGSHLFSIGGAKWRNLRAKLTPTFTTGKMRAMFQTLVECGKEMEIFLKNNVNEAEAIDAKDILERFTTDIIGSCAFGLECNEFKERVSPFRLYAEKVFRLTKLGALRAAFVLNCPKLARAFSMRAIAKDIGDFFTKVVEDTVAYREKNNVVRRDFLQLLIDIKNNNNVQENGTKAEREEKILTMPEIVAQSFVFFLAGYETSSTTMTFALYELAVNQDIQERVRKEIRTVLDKYDNKITYDAVNELKYMGQVVDETLRMYPPLPVIPRLCVKDYKIPGEDVVIEKGTRVQIPIYGIHYDKDIYEDPYTFNPERFSEENKKKRHQFAFLPFGEGPRICIGMRFGIMQTKIGLMSVLRNFKVTVNKKTKVPLKMATNSIFLTAEGGIWLNLEKI